MLVRPELGPTLGELASRRFRRPRRVLAAAGLLALAVVAAILVPLLGRGGGLDGKTQRIHESAPVFNVLYRPGLVRPVKAQPGELMRLEAQGHGIDAEIVVHPLRLPPYRGNVSGVLPIFAYRDVIAARGAAKLLEEGKARLNDAPGYQVALRTAPGTIVRHVYLLPRDRDVRDGVRITLRQTSRTGRPTAEGAKLATAIKSAFRSLRFGTERK